MIKVKHGKLDMSQLAKRVVDLATGNEPVEKLATGGLLGGAAKAKVKKKRTRK